METNYNVKYALSVYILINVCDGGHFKTHYFGFRVIKWRD